MRIYTLIAFLCLATCQLSGQMSKDEYKKRALEVRQEIWGWNIKAFDNIQVPDSMKTYSYTILARHVEMSGSSKNKIAWRGLGVGVTKELIFSRTFRERIKIQDKVALEEYSSLNYKAYEGKKFGMGTKREVITFVSARIIKPGGAMKEVDTDEAVFTTEEKNNRDAKLAIPGLEVGDILDYYVQVYDSKRTMSLSDPIVLSFVLAEDVPILHFSMHALISRKYALDHSSLNGAPMLSIKENEEDWDINVQASNLPARSTELWASRFRQLPIIRMNIVSMNPVTLGGYRAPRHKAGSLNNNVNKKELVQDIAVEAGQLRMMRQAGGFNMMEKKVKDLLKSYEKAHGKIPEDSMGIMVYYAMRFLTFYELDDNGRVQAVDVSRNYYGINENRYMLMLNEMMDLFKVETELIIATSKYGPSEKHAMIPEDFMYVIQLKKPANMFLSMETPFTIAGEVPYQYEGQNASSVVLEDKRLRINSLSKNKSFYDETQIVIPIENPGQNTHAEDLKIRFSPDNFTVLNVNRKTTLSGHFRTGVQQSLLLFEDYYEEERKRFGLKLNFNDNLLDTRKTKALAEEYRLAMKKARDGQKDLFTDEIKDQFGSKPAVVTEWKVLQSGINHQASDMIYTTTFDLDNFIKKAGNNFLLDAGKLAGGQLEITEKQRKRTDNIFMAYARCFTNNIEIKIPEGYQVEGIDKLNTKVDNAAGLFESTAIVKDNKLFLKVNKIYKKSFLKIQDFPLLLEMLDKASIYTEQKLLFKKI